MFFSQAKDLLKSEIHSTTALMSIVMELKASVQEFLQ